MVYSKYRETIFENLSYNLIINAVAGSGKTTTLIEMMKRVKGSSFFGAFNKSIAEELVKRVPRGVDVSTLHSLGLKLIRKEFGSVKISEKKVDFIMNEIADLDIRNLKDKEGAEKALVFKMRNQVRNVVSLIKACLVDYTDLNEVVETCQFYSVEFDPNLYNHICRVMVKSYEDITRVDFDDMIFFPVAYDLNSIKYQNVFIDECQDLNLCQIRLVSSIVSENDGRIYAVGDPYQSIYGFRGADSEAMDRIKEEFDSKELPLSVCYRCPTSHIELAKELVPHIEANESAPEGIVLEISDRDFEETISADVSTDPLVLCRTNAPLIRFALKLIAKGIKAIVKGKDIGSNLINIINNLHAEDIEDLYIKVDEWEATELEILSRRRASPSMKDIVEDKAEIIRLLADKCKTIKQIIEFIERIFSDAEIKGVTFSSVHKAKGLEAINVYIIRPELMPLLRDGQQEWEIQQEKNIEYVAKTRSKNKLVFVTTSLE